MTLVVKITDAFVKIFVHKSRIVKLVRSNCGDVRCMANEVLQPIGLQMFRLLGLQVKYTTSKKYDELQRNRINIAILTLPYYRRSF